jgi:type IV pilus assembly protein PilM
MGLLPFRIIPKKCLGVDLGTSSIRILELSRWGDRIKLENYGEMSAKALYVKPFRTFEKNTLLLSDKNISKAIKAILEDTKIKTRQAIISIPDFSTFFTNFELPPMTKKELEEAVVYEARRHVPLPLGEVTLDWQVVGGKLNHKQGTMLEVLLAAVPNEVINQYKALAEASGIELFALEAEVFGLLRSLVEEEDKRPIALIDVGAQTTTCSLIYNRILRTSHSFDVSGNQLTELVAKSLSVDYKRAEKLKRKYGLLPGKEIQEGKDIRKILLPIIDIMIREIERICKDFSTTEKKEIQKIIIAGSSALLPGLKEYFQENFKAEIEIANPFSEIFYPPILEKTLKEIGPAYAIAVGMALRGVE